jgi:hypothetical protein
MPGETGATSGSLGADMPGMAATMREYKKGKLRSGSKKGPKVKSRKQAIAIGLSQQRREMVKRA